MRVLFTAQDAKTIRQSIDRAKPNSEYARLYAAAVARRQADQIYNLSLTRTATVSSLRSDATLSAVGTRVASAAPRGRSCIQAEPTAPTAPNDHFPVTGREWT